MTWDTFMASVLPPKNGQNARITSGFGPRTLSPSDRSAGGRHNAVDFSYPFDEMTVDCPVYCPFDGSGVVILARWGAVIVQDSQGYQHGFFHMRNIRVSAGQSISAGKMIGLVGKTNASAAHMHYQIKKDGRCINPIQFWDGNGQNFTAPMQQETLDIANATVEGHAQTEEPASPAGFINEYKPRQAAASSPSGAIYAVWTNRVPQHEPWPRTLMVNTENLNTTTDEHEFNTRHNPQFTEDSEEGRKQIGKIEGETEITRGPFWRR